MSGLGYEVIWFFSTLNTLPFKNKFELTEKTKEYIANLMEKGFKIIGLIEIGPLLSASRGFIIHSHPHRLLAKSCCHHTVFVSWAQISVPSVMPYHVFILMRVFSQAVSCKFVCFYFFNLPILTCILQSVYRKKGTRTSSCSVCTDTPGQLSALCLDDWLTSTSCFPSSVLCVCVCVLGTSPFTIWFHCISTQLNLILEYL